VGYEKGILVIPKLLEAIAEADLVALISNGVAEGRTIEYKRELPGGTDADKKEFLADVSSFANTSGGDLVFGIEGERGLPIGIAGFQSADSDLEIRRLESIMASGLDPRIRYSIRVIDVAENRRTLVIRVDRSWSGPHRVIFKGHDKFYGRNSAGKYPLDVNELRTAFTLSATVIDRVRAFRTDRVIALSNNQTPVRFEQTSKILLHCIPVETFADRPQYDVLPFYQSSQWLPPMGTTAFDRRLNLEGLLVFGVNQPSYVQLYRNGVIEAANGSILSMDYEGKPTIPSESYERTLLEYLAKCLSAQKQLGVNVPIVIALTLTKTRGLRMGTNDKFGFGRKEIINEETLILPEVLVEDFSTPPAKILKPVFDLVWNACGYPFSRNFDAEGNWIGSR
jgi:hypothetical protein